MYLSNNKLKLASLIFISISIFISILPSNLAFANNIQTDAFYSNKKLGRGLNIGNVFESSKKGNLSSRIINSNDFNLISSAGFNSIRIPIRWSLYTEQKPPYKISDKFLKLVDETVNNAMSENLITIINIHAYKEIMTSPNQQKERFLSMWRQIAQHFSYNTSNLYFEILNEPNNKLTNSLWNSYLSEAINIIRKENPNRTILVGTTGFNSFNRLKNLKLPKNDNNLIVTLHYYNPFGFTHQGAFWISEKAKNWIGTLWKGTKKEQKSIENDFEMAYKWSIKNNIPINIGEFGSYQVADKASRIRWTSFIRAEAEKYNFSWTYWEFNAGFGVYSKKHKKWNEGLLNALQPDKK